MLRFFSDKCPTNDFLSVSPCKVINPGKHPDHQEADYGDLQQGGWVTWIVPGGSCHPVRLCKVARGYYLPGKIEEGGVACYEFVPWPRTLQKLVLSLF